MKTEIFDPAVQPNAFVPPNASPLDFALGLVNRILTILSAIALVIAGAVLTYGMFVRYWLRIPTDWQDELTVFLLVGATFLSAGYIQFKRGHVGIDALAEILPPKADRVRRWLADLLSFLFCLFFSWKSWTLVAEAIHEGQVTQTTWAPPLWIPYGMMAVGMTVLTLQLFLQLIMKRQPK
ncbi:TRAP transporter small permease [Roseiterribacter gracilis]|uniref:TRAP transporter small permease protein n=1 Tax=Roseiterribacter gracilis TaxID=2812848 RepID=A0A8S8XIE6_9PROT|nr:C4-dicarboxylate ABC transporter [Rhodospirillales bacterium TMPK1]